MQSVKKVFVITDPGLDPDDLVNAWLLAKLQQRGLIEVVGMIANFDPAVQRAMLLKGVLEDLGVDIPVGVGTSCNSDHTPRSYEFDYPNLSSCIIEGQQIWEKLLQEQEDKSISLLLISGLTDIGWAIDTFPYLVKNLIKEVYIMGGASWGRCGELIADTTASNNRFDKDLHPQEVYDFFVTNGIPMRVLSRHAAYAASIKPSFYEEVKEVNRLGQHLHKVQESATFSLWQFANQGSQDKRQNRHWFAKTFCEMEDLPISAEENPWQFVKNLALYDPLTTMWMVFPELFNPSSMNIYNVEHQIVGLSDQESGIHSPDLLVESLKEILLSQP